MANNLKKFSTESDYQSATLNYPAVSWVTSTDAVHFDKSAPTPQVAKAVAYFSNGDVVTIPYDGQTILTRLEILGDRLAEDLTAIEVGESVSEIENACFEYCSSLSSVSLTNSITTIGGGAFRETTSLGSILIPEGVTYFASEVFKNSGISDILMPNSTTEIGQKAFRNCSNLTMMLLGDEVQTINSEAFKNCTSLTSFSIGTAITEIKSSVFEGCTNLESVTVYATTPPSLSANYVFDGTSSNLVIYVPSESVEAYKAAEGWSDYASRIQAIA